MTAVEQYFPVVLFIILRKEVLTFESVDEIRWYIRSQQTEVFPGHRNSGPHCSSGHYLTLEKLPSADSVYTT